MQKFQCSVRVMVKCANSDDSGGFGPGMAQLLAGVREQHSLNKAAKSMGMAYSKAWNSINALEEGLGFKLIERKGANGSALTAEGADFLALYDRVAKAAQAAATAELEK